jgi:hypothetical protein
LTILGDISLVLFDLAASNVLISDLHDNDPHPCQRPIDSIPVHPSFCCTIDMMATNNNLDLLHSRNNNDSSTRANQPFVEVMMKSLVL